ncbi:MAG: nuclear transport factor 2 family protein [Rhodocyclaceae bacterium]|jgi:limonene-1,2-epoxide hydrolase|nr:nuclear transport factor 2 family protein [Rhodocyclaceae bacterium]
MSFRPPDGCTDDERFVLRFLDFWEKQDVDAMLACFTEDASYIDMPLPPRRGNTEIRTYIEQVFSAFSVRIETLHIASAGNVVFTERVDYLALNGAAKPPVPLPVVGVMEMRGGKIFAWRDYLDLRTAEEGLGIPIRPTSSAVA